MSNIKKDISKDVPTSMGGGGAGFCKLFGVIKFITRSIPSANDWAFYGKFSKVCGGHLRTIKPNIYIA